MIVQLLFLIHWGPWSTNVLLTKPKVTSCCSMHMLLWIYFKSKYGKNVLQNWNFDVELQVLQVYRSACKNKSYKFLTPFLHFRCPLTNTKFITCCRWFNSHFKGLGLVIQHVGKERVLHIASAYENLNPIP